MGVRPETQQEREQNRSGTELTFLSARHSDHKHIQQYTNMKYTARTWLSSSTARCHCPPLAQAFTAAPKAKWSGGTDSERITSSSAKASSHRPLDATALYTSRVRGIKHHEFVGKKFSERRRALCLQRREANFQPSRAWTGTYLTFFRWVLLLATT